VYGIKQWPSDDRPRERLRTLGPRALSPRELIALLIETGMPPRDGLPGRTAMELAGDLLHRFSGQDGRESLRKLSSAPLGALTAVRGIGPAKAAKIMAALDLGRRAAEEVRPDRERVQTARDVYERMRFRMRDLEQEEFHVLLLNTQNEIAREVFLTRGTLDSSLVHPREVFRAALHESASSMVLVHNHPSGEPAPSAEDRVITHQLVTAGDVVGIPVVDHVIIGEGKYYSFSEEGKLRADTPPVIGLPLPGGAPRAAEAA
jgi:DNA repair protein RadC